MDRKRTFYKFISRFSYNQFKDDYDTNTNSYDIKTNHVGLPFEVNLRWFKQTKKRSGFMG